MGKFYLLTWVFMTHYTGCLIMRRLSVRYVFKRLHNIGKFIRQEFIFFSQNFQISGLPDGNCLQLINEIFQVRYFCFKCSKSVVSFLVHGFIVV